MKDRPILFGAPMVRAIMSGSKTQTRRAFNDKANWHFIEGQGDLSICPYGQPGDRLWVREAWMPVEHDTQHVRYRATNPSYAGKWRPSIHMPRWASRITLEVTDVRVERLQDISEADSLAEGIREWMADLALDPKVSAADVDALAARYGVGPRAVYAALWPQINGAGSWDANPWVWAISFRRIEP